MRRAGQILEWWGHWSKISWQISLCFICLFFAYLLYLSCANNHVLHERCYTSYMMSTTAVLKISQAKVLHEVGWKVINKKNYVCGMKKKYRCSIAQSLSKSLRGRGSANKFVSKQLGPLPVKQCKMLFILDWHMLFIRIAPCIPRVRNHRISFSDSTGHQLLTLNVRSEDGKLHFWGGDNKRRARWWNIRASKCRTYARSGDFTTQT